MRLFAARGYAATSVADIEQAAGLTPGAGGLFHHFRSKESVLAAGIERHLGRLEAVRQLRRVIPPLGDVRAELTLLGRYVLLEMAEERELIRVLFTEARLRPALLGEAVERLVRDSFREFTAWLDEHVAAGRALARPPEAVAAVAFGAIGYYRAAEALLGEPPVEIDEEEFIETWVDMVARFIEAPTSGSGRAPRRAPRRS